MKDINRNFLEPSDYKYLFFAWLFPGAGHFMLGFKRKAFIIGGIIIFMILYGLYLHGHIYTPSDQLQLFKLGSLFELGMGPLYFILSATPLRAGVVKSFTFEYGTSFILTGAILNYFAIIDVADHLLGRHKNSIWEENNH